MPRNVDLITVVGIRNADHGIVASPFLHISRKMKTKPKTSEFLEERRRT
jgi:hypothetical protein